MHETDAYARFATLDAETRAMVVAVFGREPEPNLGEDEANRLAAVIDAVQSGQGAEGTPETPEEKAAPELPPMPPPDVELLRARIRNMDEAAREVFLQRWTMSGLGPLAAPDGTGLLLPLDTFKAIEQLVADHEPPAPEGAHAWLTSTLTAMQPGPMRVAENRLLQQFAANVLTQPLAMTAGRYAVCGEVVAAVLDEAEEVVAAALGPVADPVAEVITTPVADEAELREALPPKAKVAEVLAWVGADLARARFALAAEQARTKPRDGVVNKLAPLVGGEALPPASTPPAAEAEGVTAPAVPAAAPAPSAPSPVIEGQTTLDDHLTPEADAALAATDDLEAFAQVPAAQWGPLTTIAYLRQLAANAEKVARTIQETLR